MKIQYFADTDTLLITLNDHPVVETRDLDENTTLDLGSAGEVIALTLEHASRRTDVGSFTIQSRGALASAAS